MHFSVLTLLACALLNVSAAPVPEKGIAVDIPVKVTDVLVGDTVEILNNILKGGKRHGDDGISLTAPIKVNNVGNGNVIDILDGLLSGGKRDGISVDVPITISDILNCDDLKVANHILSGLASALERPVSQLGITAQDVLDCDASSVGELIRKITGSLGKTKRHGDDGINVDIPINLENILNGNVIKVLNNLLHGKRDGISITAPIDVSHVADYNIVDILNGILKRNDGGVSVNAPVDVWNVANGNDVGILNNL